MLPDANILRQDSLACSSETFKEILQKFSSFLLVSSTNFSKYKHKHVCILSLGKKNSMGDFTLDCIHTVFHKGVSLF